MLTYNPLIDDPAPVHASQPKIAPPQDARSNGRRKAVAARFRLFDTFMNCSVRNLTRAEALTWFALWQFADPSGRVRTCQSSIQERIGADLRTVKRAIRRLENPLQLLKVVCRGNSVKGPSTYQLLGATP